ncbi:Vacuolar ATPase assembly integral membrane protein VMA21 like, partial [Pseudolycoriella hygida]
VAASDSTAFQTVLFYCLLIIFLPIVTFFSLKYMLFDTVLQATSVQSNIYSAVAAVVALHFALGLYLYRAYFNAEATASPKED